MYKNQFYHIFLDSEDVVLQGIKIASNNGILQRGNIVVIKTREEENTLNIISIELENN